MLRQDTNQRKQIKKLLALIFRELEQLQFACGESLPHLDGRHNYGYRDLCSKKIQAISLNYTWLSCALNRYIYRRFIDPLLYQKRKRTSGYRSVEMGAKDVYWPICMICSTHLSATALLGSFS